MSDTNKEIKKTSLVLPLYLGLGIGALLGLIAYVKDWL
jgi:hypothetical protein